MFDFEQLIVYKKAKELYRQLILTLKSDRTIHRSTSDQLTRAALSIPLNIAEGSGRFSKADKRYFYVIARGSVYECVAILDILKDSKYISSEQYDQYYSEYTEVSKMLIGLIKSQS